MPFHNPYHFVPIGNINQHDDLSRTDFDANTAKAYSKSFTHDRYVTGTYSGRIVCRVTAKTPFSVGAQQTADEHKRTPTIVEQFTLDDWPAIPASSLRGMLSSIIEAAGSALRVLDDIPYSYRKEARYPLKRIGMIMERADGKFEMVRLALFDAQRRSWSNARMVRLPHGHDFKTFSLAAPQYYYCWDGQGAPPAGTVISELAWSRLSRGYQDQYVKGFLRIMENDERAEEFREIGRNKEVFLLWDPQKDGSLENRKDNLPVSDDAVRDFYEIADYRTEADDKLPYEPVGTARNLDPDDKRIRLKSGDLVYYGTAGTGTTEAVTEISFSAIWRGRVKETTHDFFRSIDPDLVPFCTDRSRITTAEQIFGFVEASGKNGATPTLALAGRIFPSNAVLVGLTQEGGSVSRPPKPEDCYEINPIDSDGFVLKTLASPKPPSPAMYFKSKNGTGYVGKSALDTKSGEPQGRKFYLHHSSAQIDSWKSRKPDEKANLKMKVRPVRSGSVFAFHVDFNNLTEHELGALLYSLQPTTNFQHKIGLGKPIGLGSIKVEPLGVFLVDRPSRYAVSGMGETRYGRAWMHESGLMGAVSGDYAEERAATQNMAADEVSNLRDAFRATIPKKIALAIEAIGDPVSLAGLPVHYPSGSAETESEHFRWFVANDRATTKQSLREIQDGNIPSLT